MVIICDLGRYVLQITVPFDEKSYTSWELPCITVKSIQNFTQQKTADQRLCKAVNSKYAKYLEACW